MTVSKYSSPRSSKRSRLIPRKKSAAARSSADLPPRAPQNAVIVGTADAQTRPTRPLSPCPFRTKKKSSAPKEPIKSGPAIHEEDWAAEKARAAENAGAKLSGPSVDTRTLNSWTPSEGQAGAHHEGGWARNQVSVFAGSPWTERRCLSAQARSSAQHRLAWDAISPKAPASLRRSGEGTFRCDK
jgi:hypothetical protein